MRSHSTVAYLFYTSLDCILEQEIYKSSIVRPIGANSVPMGGCQALIGFLGLESFLGWGYPYEVSIAEFGVVIHKYSGFL